MIEVYNAITNIAKRIEHNVFSNYDDFTDDGRKSTQLIHKDVYNYCLNLIETEFEYLKSVKGLVAKNKKLFCKFNDKGKYLVSTVVIDNIDLLDLNFSLGTIFGIYENEFEADNLKAAIYVTYGPTFQLVFASKTEGVKYFSNEHGDFIQQDSLELNNSGMINSTAGKLIEFDQQHKDLLESFFNDGHRLRFSNSLALDTHQILFKKGGIYTSPSTPSNPNGTLEVIFEAFPMAFVIELAGGEAIVDANTRVLDIKSPSFNQKTPIYFGSKGEIARVKSTLKK